MNVKGLTLSEIRDKIANKEISAVQTVEAYIEENRKKKDLNALLIDDFENALSQAKKTDEQIALGKPVGVLAGVPVVIKDNIAVKDVRMTCASRLLENYVSPYDATLVVKLKNAGAIILGKSNMDEFAMGATNANSAFGKVKNPLDQSCVPGGSSGGSAACVAAGLCAAAIGTDTGGSIRQPSAFCGVVGMKPTYGTVSRFGVTAFASSLDQAGPITATVKDNALILSVISGKDARDCTSADVITDCVDPKALVKGRKIGVIKQILDSPILSDAVKSAFDRAVESVRAEGAIIDYVDMPSFPAGIATYFAISTAEAASNLSRFDGVRYGVRKTGEGGVIASTRENGFGTEVKKRIMTGNMVLLGDNYQKYYVKAMKMRARIRAELDGILSVRDLIMTPTAPTTALPFDFVPSNLYEEYYGDMFTVIANLSGNPALSVPIKTEGKLSAGLQLIGKRFDEKTLYSVGAAIEEAQK